MSKFKKLLFLTLSVVFVITALAITAAAAYTGESLFVFDWTDTESVTETHADRIGKFQLGTEEDGNKYLQLHSYDPDHTSLVTEDGETVYEGTSVEVLTKLAYDDSGKTDYNVYNYRYAVMDFHIKKENDNGFPGIVITSMSHSSTGVGSNRFTSNNEPRFKFYSGADGYDAYNALLPEKAGEWAHVSVVNLSKVNTSNKYTGCTLSVYINGQLAYSEDFNTASTYSPWDTFVQKFSIKTYSVNQEEYGTEDGNRVAGFDNINISYFHKDDFASSAAVAEYIYESRGKELPYGNTVASVGEQIFDNIYEAIDYANGTGETVELKANFDETIFVEKAVAIEKGEYAAEFEYDIAALTMTVAGTKVIFAEHTEDFDLLLIKADGSLGYYDASEYSAAFTAAKAETSATIMLNNDIQVSDTIAFTTAANVTLDLNGYTLKRFNEYGTVYIMNSETGEYDTDITTSSSKYAFTIENNKATSGKTAYFTLTSSREGGKIVNAYIKKDFYYDTDKTTLLDTQVGNVETGNLIYTDELVGGEINVSNVEIQSESLVYVKGSSTKNVTMNVENVTFYRIRGASKVAYMENIFAVQTSNAVNMYVKDSKFFDATNIYSSNSVAPEFIKCENSSNASKFVFDNCDIISTRTQRTIRLAGTKATLECNNCRIYNVYCNTSTSTDNNVPTLGNGTLYNYGTSYPSSFIVESGCVLSTASKSITYSGLSNSAHTFTYDAATGEIADIEKTTVTYTFTGEVVPCSEVEGSIPDAKLSMIYTTGFKMMLYIPVMEGRTITTPDGFTALAETVLIDKVEHHVFEMELTTAGAGDSVYTKLAYTVGEASYRQDYYLSALVYADIVLSDENASDLEVSAVGNMVRYIKEAVLYGDEAADTTAFDELITKSKIAEYATEYTDTADYSEIAEYLTSISFTITDGVASYKIVLTDASYANTVAVSTDDKTFELEVNDATVIVKSARVYDVIDTITVTINGASGTYSILENIEGVAAAGDDTGLLKAIYEFGVAAKAYRENRTDY